MRLFKTQGELINSIKSLAQELNSKYSGLNNITFLVVLDGSLRFFAELQNHLNFSYQVSTIKLKSYIGTDSTGVIEDSNDYDKLCLTNRRIIIIEDIVDSGKTLLHLKSRLEYHTKIENIEVVSMLVRKRSRELVNRFCFEVENNDFLVGFGMDYNNEFRDQNNLLYYESRF